MEYCALMSLLVHAHAMIGSVSQFSNPFCLHALGSLQPEIAGCHSQICPFPYEEWLAMGMEELRWDLSRSSHQSLGLCTLWIHMIQMLLNTLAKLVQCTQAQLTTSHQKGVSALSSTHQDPSQHTKGPGFTASYSMQMHQAVCHCSGGSIQNIVHGKSQQPADGHCSQLCIVLFGCPIAEPGLAHAHAGALPSCNLTAHQSAP